MKIEKLRLKKATIKDNLIFIAFCLVFLLQAYMHNNNIVYLFIFFVVGIVLNNYFLTKKNIKGLEFFFINIENQFAKESLKIHIRVENRTEIDRYDIHINDEISFSIPANSKKEIILTKLYPKRGKYKLEPLIVTSSFPLYLFDQYYAELDLNQEIIIYPAKEGESLDKFFGKEKSIYGEREDFKGVREYRESDSFSQIHWKSLAKGKLMTKEYYYEIERDTYDFDYNRISGDIEKRLSQLTLWVIEANKKGYNYRVKLPNRILNSLDYSLKEILTTLALFKE